MRILVIGSGGREHALCWKLAQTPEVEIFANPGNPGMAHVGTCVPGEALAAAEKLKPDLTVVGPEAPLVAGVADSLRANGLRVVGPGAEAARLEGSKIFAKNFMAERAIPSARFETVETPAQAAMALGRFSFPLVLKEDGLAAGKGVVIARDRS
jgi:phosphoribosylamine---glycine ligase